MILILTTSHLFIHPFSRHPTIHLSIHTFIHLIVSQETWDISASTWHIKNHCPLILHSIYVSFSFRWPMVTVKNGFAETLKCIEKKTSVFEIEIHTRCDRSKVWGDDDQDIHQYQNQLIISWSMQLMRRLSVSLHSALFFSHWSFQNEPNCAKKKLTPKALANWYINMCVFYTNIGPKVFISIQTFDN